jgi:uncharacterized protein YoxC
MTEAAASEMAQTAQALGASVSTIWQQTESMTAELREHARDMQLAIDQVAERSESIASTFRM